MANKNLAILQGFTMKNQLSCFYKLPLKQIAVRRVAVILCKSPGLLRFVASINLTPQSETDRNRETAVKCKVEEILLELSLDESTKEAILWLMKPLCREIAKWIHFHEDFCKNYKLHSVDILQHICWTPLGTIDNVKTAIKLIRHEKLDIDDRYKLACLYCITDYIRDLWEKLPQESVEKNSWERETGKISFYNDKSPFHVQQPEIVIFWTYFLEGREDKYEIFHRRVLLRHASFHQSAFEYVAFQGHKTAARHFLRKLKGVDREMSLVRAARAVASRRTFDSCSYRLEYQKFSDVLFYLFSKASEKQLLMVFKTHPFEILKCCLDWPRQEIFVDVAQLAFSYLKEEDYSRLVFIISKNIKWGYDYSNIFKKLFLNSPRKFRLYSLRRYGYFIQELFKAEDGDTVKFIFRNLYPGDILRLLYSTSSFGCCYDLIGWNKWESVELMFRETVQSQTDMYTMNFGQRVLRFGKQMLYFAKHNHPTTLCNESYEKFVVIVNSLEASISKFARSTQINLPPTADFPDIDLEENPAKKLKKV